MITIYSVMLVTLGFLVALLLGFLFAPAYRKRAERLTAQRLRRSMPVNEAEIRADKDRLRAEHAVRVHDLEMKVTSVALAAARRNIEINRRDAAISSLESEIDRLQTSLEEHNNARRVLEQTVTDRLPRVEHRLQEAKRILEQRDREIAELTYSSGSQARALIEAKELNSQQRDELLRINAAVTSRLGGRRDGASGSRFAPDPALEAEVSALRTKTHEQAALIGRLQALVNRTPDTELRIDGLPRSSDGDLLDLREHIAEAEALIEGVQSTPADAAQARAESDADRRALKIANQDQATEIARLRAALTAWEGKDDEVRTGKESKIALKARVSALQAQTEEQQRVLQTLRAEVASANEKLARQAAFYRDEMRKIGAGPIAGGIGPRTGSRPRGRKPLTERIHEPRLVQAEDTAQDSTAGEERVLGFKSALAGGQGEESRRNGTHGSGAGDNNAAPQDGDRKPRLVDRITGLDKSAG